MEHEYWEERVQGYIDNELDPADHTAVEAHVNACEECSANVSYYRNMKKRLALHSSTVEMPAAVQERLEARFRRKRRPWRNFILPGAGITLAAAAILLFAFLPKTPPAFEPDTLVGEITCYDCAVAAKCGLEKGELCGDRHVMGMMAEDGSIWRFASDEQGRNFIRDFSLFYGKAAEVKGSVLSEHHLVRVNEIKLVNNHQAGL